MKTDGLTPEEKKARFAAFQKECEQKYGKGSVSYLAGQPTNYPHYPTGILSLDEAIGIGGLPKGRIVEIYGPEAAGKTLITLQCIAETQRRGGCCAFIDAENALNVSFAEKIGVKTDELVFSQPQSGEEGLDIMIQMVMTGLFDLIVVDSVAALTPQAEIDGEMGDLQVGAQARMMSKALRKASPIINRMGCTVVFINQLREKIGTAYGNPETTTGGRALKFYASLRLDVRRSEVIKNGSEIVGNQVKVKVVKNKVAPPFKQASFELLFASGVSREGQILDKSVEFGLIKKSGSWYSYKGESLGQGAEQARQWLAEHADICAGLEKQVLSEMGILDDSEVDQSLILTQAENLDQPASELSADEFLAEMELD